MNSMTTRITGSILVATAALAAVVSPTESLAQRESGPPGRINAPKGNRKFGVIDGGGVYKWTGVVRDVWIERINGNTTLDLSGLQAANITIGEIDGACGVLLNATGNVTINGKIDGRSWVACNAGGDILINGKIDGRSRVRLKAGGNIRVAQKLDGGPCTILVASAEGNLDIADQFNGKSVFVEDEIQNPFDMRAFPFDKVCDSDAQDYPKPKLP
jgi:hypothetical protein